MIEIVQRIVVNYFSLWRVRRYSRSIKIELFRRHLVFAYLISILCTGKFLHNCRFRFQILKNANVPKIPESLENHEHRTRAIISKNFYYLHRYGVNASKNFY